MKCVFQGIHSYYAKLIAEEAVYRGPKELTQYTVQSVKFSDKAPPVDRPGRLTVDIKLNRSLVYVMLTTFLPTFIVSLLQNVEVNFF